MAIFSTFEHGKAKYGLKHYVVDAAADLPDLPIDLVWVGSTAYVIATGDTYMFNGNKEWVKIVTGGGGGGGGSGTAATIQVGTVTTGQPGSNVTIQNVGTESAAIFDFSIPRGDPFQIKKVYDSVSDMNDDYNNPDIAIGDLVAIVSDPSDPDNASLYVKGDTQYEFFMDMSGATGIRGETGARGPKGEQGDPFTYEDFTPAQLAGLKGDTGIGIASVVLNNDYTLTFTYTDGTTYTSGSVQGPKGDAFEYSDFTPEQLEALTGPQGPVGPAGADGQPGPAGADGAQGPQGIQGDAGPSGVGIASVTQGVEDNTVRITLTNGTYYEVELDTIQGPQGEKGDTFTYSDLTPAQIASLKGAKGDTGAQGSAGTITIGTVTTGATPSVTNVGTPQNAILNIVLPAGSAYPIVGTYPTTSDAEADIANIPANSMVIIAGSGSDNGDVLINEGGTLVYVTNLTGAQGIQGPQGETGAAATITVGTVTTGAVPSVTNSGTSSAVVLDFVLPAATLEGITLPTVQDWENGDKVVVTDPDGEISKLDIDEVGKKIIKGTEDEDLTTNNKTIEGAINELDDVKVPETRRIAGLDLDEDITKDELLEALGIVLAAGNTVTIGGLTVYRQRQTSREILSKTAIPELTGTISFFQNGVNVYGNLSIMANSNTFTISDESDPETNIKDALVIQGDFGLLPIPGAATTYDSHQCGIGPCHCERGGIQNFRIVTNSADTEIIEIHGWIEGTIGPKRVDNVFLNRPFVYMTESIEGVGVEYDHHNLNVTGWLTLNNSTANANNCIAFGNDSSAINLDPDHDSGVRMAVGYKNVVYGANSAAFGDDNIILRQRSICAGDYHLVGEENGAFGYHNDLITGRFTKGTITCGNWGKTLSSGYSNGAIYYTYKHYDALYVNGNYYGNQDHLYLNESCTTEVTGNNIFVYADKLYYKYNDEWYSTTSDYACYTKITGDTQFIQCHREGEKSLASGSTNVIAGASSFANGYGNAVKGEGCAVFGKFNNIDSLRACFASGEYNYLGGSNFCAGVFGMYNACEGSSCLVVGYYNYSIGEGALVSGKFNYNTAATTIVGGNYNAVSGTESLVTGYNNKIFSVEKSIIGGTNVFAKSISGERDRTFNSIAVGNSLDLAGKSNALFGSGNKVFDYQSIASGIGNKIGEELVDKDSIPYGDLVNNYYYNPADGYFYTTSEFDTKITPDTTKYYLDKTALSTNGEQRVGNELYYKYNQTDDNFYVVFKGPNNKNLYGANSIEGINNTIGGTAYGTHVEGTGNTSVDSFAHVEGCGNTTAGGDSHHVEGQSNTVTSYAGHVLHVEGQNNTATDGSSACHLEGGSNTTSQGASFTHVEGFGNVASGSYAHVEGCNNNAGPGTSYVHVEGYSNSLGAGLGKIHVEGCYNVVNPGSINGNYGCHIGGYAADFTGMNTANPAIEIIGNGNVNTSGSTPVITGSNARVLRRNGDETLAGKLTIGGTPIDVNDVITIQFLIDNLADAYDNTATYALDAIVLYQGKLYKCTTAVETAEDFDDTKWTRTKIVDLL